MSVTWKEKSDEAKALFAEVKEANQEGTSKEDRPTGEKATELARKVSRANDLIAEARDLKAQDDLKRGEELLAEIEKKGDKGNKGDGLTAALEGTKKTAAGVRDSDDYGEIVKEKHGVKFSKRVMQEMGLKALNEGSGGAGNFLVPPQYLQDLFAGTRRQGNALRRNDLLNEVPTNSNQILLPRGTGAATVGIVAENATKPSADQQFTQVTINVFTLAGIAKLSKQMAMDADPAAATLVTQELGTLLGNLEEQKIYNGSGTGEPRGILNTTGTAAIPAATQTALNGTVTAQILIDAIYDAVVAVQTTYFGVPNAIVMHPKRLAFLMKGKDTTTNYLFNPAGTFRAPGGLGGLTAMESGFAPLATLAGIPILTSANIPTTLGGGTQDAVIVGDFQRAWWFQRQETTLDVSDTAGTAFETNQVWYRLEERAAFSIEQYPAAFCAFTGTGVV